MAGELFAIIWALNLFISQSRRLDIINSGILVILRCVYLYRNLSLLVVITLFLPNFVLDSIVFSKIRNATEGKLRGFVLGGCALPFHIDEFFNNIGIQVFEGYGMTETSPVISLRSFEKLISS